MSACFAGFFVLPPVSIATVFAIPENLSETESTSSGFIPVSAYESAIILCKYFICHIAATSLHSWSGGILRNVISRVQSRGCLLITYSAEVQVTEQTID